VLLIDNSAWARLASERLDAARAETVAAWMGELQLATCLPFLLEAGYSARSGSERSAMMADLEKLPRVEIDKDIEAAALDAQRGLADIGHHRLPPADVMIAACAHVAWHGRAPLRQRLRSARRAHEPRVRERVAHRAGRPLITAAVTRHLPAHQRHTSNTSGASQTGA
jgi:predicted nucleic acid-binding protein